MGHNVGKLHFDYTNAYSIPEAILMCTQYCAGDKIEKNEMGWACGSYGGGDGGI